MTRNSQIIINILVCLLVFLVSPTEILAEEVKLRPENFTHLTIEDGLPQNNVRCIEEDQYGFLWLCTADGLVRYDGYDFELVTEGTDGSRISNTIVRTILADGDNLWIGTDNGVNRFDLKSGQFVYHYVFDGGIRSNKIRSFESTGNRIFVGTGKGLYQIDKLSGKYKEIQLPEKYSYIRALKINNEVLYIGGYRAGIIKYSIADEKIEKKYEDKINNKILTIEHINNELWIGLFAGSYYNIDENLTEKKITQSCNEKNRLCDGNANIFSIKKNKSIIWLAGSDGIYKISKENVLKKIDLLNYVSNPYISNSVSSLFFLNEDQMFCTLNPGGVIKLQLSESIFTKFPKDKMVNNNRSNDEIYAIEKYNNEIYVGSYNGLMMINKEQKISSVSFNENTYTDNYQFRINSLKSIKKNLYIGSYSGLFSVITIDGKHEISKINLDAHVTALDSDKDNSLWVATSNGDVYKVSSPLDIQVIPKISALNISNITELLVTEKTIYIGTIGYGLAVYDRDSKNIKIYNSKNSVLLSDAVLSLSKQANDIWIGTRGGALSKLNVKTNLLKQYGFISGKIGNTIYSIQTDEYENVWTATNNGIVAINSNSKKEKHFTIRSGLLDKEYNHNASQYIDGFVYFGGAKGITKIDTKILNYSKENIASVYLSKVTISSAENNRIMKIYGPEISTISAKYGSAINIYLTTNKLNVKNILNFEYKLQGGNVNAIWTEIKEGARELSLDFLNPGSYTLMLRAKNFNNTILKNKELNIIIHPPIWQSNYAIFMYILVALSLIIFITRIYIKIKIANEKNYSFRTELENRKKNIATLSHDLRTPLNSIVMLSDPHITINEDRKDIIHNSAILLRSLVSNALDQSLLEIGSKIQIKISSIKIQNIFSSMINILKSYYEEKNIQIITKINIEDDTLFYTDKTRLEQICINILTNAIKHSPQNSSVVVDIELVGEILVIKMKDFGSGIPISEQKDIFKAFYKAKENSKSGLGLGLFISKQIINSLGGDISINSSFTEGTEFVLKIPNATDTELNEVIENNDCSIKTEKLKILMIDDDPFNRVAFGAMCAQINIKITCVATIQEFLEVDDLFDMYFLDLNLAEGDMDGIRLAEHLVKQGDLTPKILLTADVRASEKIINPAINDIIIKPITLDELIVIVNKNVLTN